MCSRCVACARRATRSLWCVAAEPGRAPTVLVPDAVSRVPRPRPIPKLDSPGPVVGALKGHRVRQIEERLAAGSAWQDSGLVFTTTIGTPINPSNLRRSFRRVTTAAGLGRWHPHELRHSAASLLSAAGVPLEVVADVLGHDGTRMTALVYRHAVSPTVGAAMAPMESLFGSA